VGLAWHIEGSKTNKGTVAAVYRWGPRIGTATVLGSTPLAVFRVEMYTIGACVMGNVDQGYTGRNIYIICDRQTDTQPSRPLTASR
jgi:hypothetical protein